MQVIKLLFLLLLVAVPAFAEGLSDLTPSDAPLIDVDNATNATKPSFSANATAGFNSANATNATGTTGTTASVNKSNSTTEAESNQAPANTGQKTAAELTEQADKSGKIGMSRNTTGPSGVQTVPLSYLTSMRALIEARKLEVALAKEDKKLRELFAPDPALIKASQKEKKQSKKRKSRPVWPRIISIQGVDGRLSATLLSSAGVETVERGDKAGPGKVVSITPSKVLVRFNGRNIPLKFKE
ncbi:type IV pilus biogenesis protein PilP [Maridesulfovibrio hydrothermalis]|uniref:Type IV pilus biogenesis protein PilP n=1 Tax=Maridesulfovibrio hydrothermalis AM13 = DSM 14728 TaxID=1121451 RepID=L0RB96_9BACT|nr:type IV pilus biogenesis protein PilP [Maridesulfovibrio hydrothermalis]CCO24024.1 Type IV pilus biogenesis protein PilP [Maridesulfovibrio hydrothermalis AM13 = DSM 14728]